MTTWTPPKTWAGSEVLTSPDMNTYNRDNLLHLDENKADANTWLSGSVTVISQPNQRLESGKGTMVVTTNFYGSQQITFSTAFGTAPRVIGNSVEILNLLFSPSSITTTGYRANLSISGTYNGTFTGTYLFNWLAIGA